MTRKLSLVVENCWQVECSSDLYSLMLHDKKMPIQSDHRHSPWVILVRLAQVHRIHGGYITMVSEDITRRAWHALLAILPST